jgi:hypothetical protein
MAVRPIREWPFGGPIPGLSGRRIGTSCGVATPAARRAIPRPDNAFLKRTLVGRKIGQIYSLRVYRRALSARHDIT